MKRTTLGAMLVLAGAVPAGLAAQKVPLAPAPAAAPSRTAKPEDVKSVDAIIKAVYDVISGPAGQKRDWDRWRTLFAPGARLVPTTKDSTGKSKIVGAWSPDEYAFRVGGRLEQGGFFEREIGRTVQQYGSIVQAFSAYDSKKTLADPKPFARGINSFQLFNDGTRWWVVTIFWEGETPANPIPAKYLKS